MRWAPPRQVKRNSKRLDESLAGKIERAMGVEPVSEAWRASVLPLNYTRIPSAMQSKRHVAERVSVFLSLSSPRCEFWLWKEP